MPDRVFRGLRAVLLAVVVTALVIVGRLILDQVVGPRGWYVLLFAGVFVTSYLTFWLIKKTYGLRVTAEEEEAGLDISEHGMYGYPEQFIPVPELIGYATAPHGSRDIATPARPVQREVPAT